MRSAKRPAHHISVGSPSLEWIPFVKTNCFNSNKVFAIWR